MDRFSALISDIGALLAVYWESYLVNLGKTLLLALVATVIGCLIGLVCGILNTIPYTKNDNWFKRFFLKLVRVIVRVYVEVFRGTPMVLQAVFIFYGLPYFSNNQYSFSSMWAAAILIVSINTGAYMTETVRGGILSIDPGQTEGAKAIGMTHFQTMLYIVFPQTLRNILPQIGNNLIINIKDTSVLFVIGVTELFSRGKSVAGALYTYFETFTLVMIFYFIMTFVCSRLLRLWEKKMDGADSYDLATTDTLAHTSGMITHPDVYKTGNSNLDQRDSK